MEIGNYERGIQSPHPQALDYLSAFQALKWDKSSRHQGITPAGLCIDFQGRIPYPLRVLSGFTPTPQREDKSRYRYLTPP